MLRFKSLSSGSSGNCTVVESMGIAPMRVLVDCGLGLKHLSARLGEAGLQPDDIHAVFITHEHGDHIGCARSLSLRYRIPVWMSHGTHAAIGAPDFDGLLRTARDGKAIDLGGMQITPFTVPHDAREPLQLTCTDGSAKGCPRPSRSPKRSASTRRAAATWSTRRASASSASAPDER